MNHNSDRKKVILKKVWSQNNRKAKWIFLYLHWKSFISNNCCQYSKELTASCLKSNSSRGVENCCWVSSNSDNSGFEKLLHRVVHLCIGSWLFVILITNNDNDKISGMEHKFLLKLNTYFTKCYQLCPIVAFSFTPPWGSLFPSSIKPPRTKLFLAPL